MNELLVMKETGSKSTPEFNAELEDQPLNNDCVEINTFNPLEV